jgi:purine nucleosidase
MNKLLIDTDTASDDAVALIMAHHWTDVEVVAVTIVNAHIPPFQLSQSIILNRQK